MTPFVRQRCPGYETRPGVDAAGGEPDETVPDLRRRSRGARYPSTALLGLSEVDISVA